MATAVILDFRTSGNNSAADWRPIWLGLWLGAFTFVGWHVTLCDPMRQVTLRGHEMGFH